MERTAHITLSSGGVATELEGCRTCGLLLTEVMQGWKRKPVPGGHGPRARARAPHLKTKSRHFTKGRNCFKLKLHLLSSERILLFQGNKRGTGSGLAIETVVRASTSCLLFAVPIFRVPGPASNLPGTSRQSLAAHGTKPERP